MRNSPPACSHAHLPWQLQNLCWCCWCNQTDIKSFLTSDGSWNCHKHLQILDPCVTLCREIVNANHDAVLSFQSLSPVPQCWKLKMPLAVSAAWQVFTLSNLSSYSSYLNKVTECFSDGGQKQTIKAKANKTEETVKTNNHRRLKSY